jgi:hypothetical protein
MLADAHLALTRALDVELDLSAVLGTVRCKRFSLLVSPTTHCSLLKHPVAQRILAF